MSSDQPYAKPLPITRPIDEPFWASAREGQLRLQHCNSCGHWWHPPNEFCPNCLSHDFSWDAISGQGRIWTRIFMHQRYFAAFDDERPYNIVWVELDEGPMLTGNVVDASSDELVCDARVEIVYDPVTPDVTIPRFRLL